MTSSYPGALDSLTNPLGTQTLDNPSHSAQHANANDILEAVETTVGTTAGTNVLMHFAAGQFPVRNTGGGATGTLVQTLAGGTLTSPVINTGTLASPVINVTSDAAGDLYYRNAGGSVARLAIGAANDFLMTFGGLPSWSGARYKAGAFTRDLTVASGTVTYSGVGFPPKLVLFFCGVNGTFTSSFGVDDLTTPGCIAQDALNVWTFDTSNSLYLQSAAGARQTGKISGVGTGSFDIAWTKTNSPTTTAQVIYVALR